MEKCPNCGHWTFDFSPTQSKAVCFTCSHTEQVDSKKYQEINDLMPKLIKSLELNGIKIQQC
jgi:acetyl-CoA carboxylase beta subunit